MQPLTALYYYNSYYYLIIISAVVKVVITISTLIGIFTQNLLNIVLKHKINKNTYIGLIKKHQL